LPKQLTHSVAALAPEIELRKAERRAEARYRTQDPAEIEVLPGPGEPGPGEPVYGTVLDVSRSGLRIALRKRISRGVQIMVKLNRNAIFGEVRYCRTVADGFQAGVRIQDLVLPASRQNEHIADDPLSLYAVGKGLAVAEVIELREHLAQCEACRARLVEKEDILSPGGKHRRRLSLHSRD
jgi:hypothetical protein